MLHRTFNRPFDAALAASALNAYLAKTRPLLADLADGGWLARVRQGWYITVPIDASEPRQWREDPWIVATALFEPCYIGGWSASEHWGFTDELFSSTYVVARRKVKPTDQIIQGSRFKLRSVPQQEWFGTQETLRRDTAVTVSDPHRTVVDVMDVPEAAGGALHAAEIVRAYFHSEHADEQQLLSHGERLGRGALFKRLGYLAERDGLGSSSRPSLSIPCRAAAARSESNLTHSVNPREGRYSPVRATVRATVVRRSGRPVGLLIAGWLRDCAGQSLPDPALPLS
ncbi:MAG: hypothetical protein M5U09_22865 [Gammaproteobacteria bacterium]|nr:hypothetical protein [Gammaproteobacteria bacterium]